MSSAHRPIFLCPSEVGEDPLNPPVDPSEIRRETATPWTGRVRFVIARGESCKAEISFVAIGDNPPVQHRPHLSSPGCLPSPNRYSALTHYGVPAISEERPIGDRHRIAGVAGWLLRPWRLAWSRDIM